VEEERSDLLHLLFCPMY